MYLANPDKEAAMEELRKIPSVNENAAEALWFLGIRSVQDLKGRDATAMYEELRNRKGSYAEPCMLNILKVAIHHASKKK
jgi:hypothetical protein